MLTNTSHQILSTFDLFEETMIEFQRKKEEEDSKKNLKLLVEFETSIAYEEKNSMKIEEIKYRKKESKIKIVDLRKKSNTKSNSLF